MRLIRGIIDRGRCPVSYWDGDKGHEILKLGTLSKYLDHSCFYEIELKGLFSGIDYRCKGEVNLDWRSVYNLDLALWQVDFPR